MAKSVGTAKQTVQIKVKVTIIYYEFLNCLKVLFLIKFSTKITEIFINQYIYHLSFAYTCNALLDHWPTFLLKWFFLLKYKIKLIHLQRTTIFFCLITVYCNTHEYWNLKVETDKKSFMNINKWVKTG